AGLVVRGASRRASSGRAREARRDYLAGAGVVGLEGVDTRRLTLRIREAGAMRAAVSTVDLDPASLRERVRAQPGMEGTDLAASASTRPAYRARDVAGPARPTDRPGLRVGASDFGVHR